MFKFGRQIVYFSALLLCFAVICPPVSASEYREAEALFAKKDYLKAAALFQKAQAKRDNAPNAAYYEALCYHYCHDMAKAKLAYVNVVNKFPETEASENALKVLCKMDPLIAQQYKKVMDGITARQNQEYAKLPKQTSVNFSRHRLAPGHLIVPTIVNGVCTFMIFDTGATVTHITERWLTMQGIKPKYTKYTDRVTGVGGEVRTRVALLTIQVGMLERTIPVSVQSGSVASGDEISNPLVESPLLGQTFYKDFIYEIDDANHKINFKKLASRPDETKKTNLNKYRKVADNEVPFYYEGNAIIVAVKLNGRECEMIFDTGANSIAFADHHLASCGINRPIESMDALGVGVGGERKAYAFYLDSVQMGPITKKDVECIVMMHSPFPRPLLGQTFLAGLKYTIDPGRKVIIFN